MKTNRWRVKNDDLPLYFQAKEQCLQQSLPDDLGKGCSEIFQLDGDLSYIKTDYTPNKDLAILSQIETQEPRMVVTLGLKGQSCFAGNQGEELIFNQGYTSIATFNSSVGERQYQAHQAITQLRLSVSKHWLDNYLGEQNTTQLFDKNTTRILACQPISAQGMAVAQHLLNLDVKSEVKRLFIHAQALSLLAAELSCLFEEPKADYRFSKRDKSIAQLAHDILEQEFQNPPSIAELARRVGTNHCKLKKIFQHYFDNTPYGVLLDIRMNKAYQLLASQHCQVSVAADYVGYSHANNFSVAFTKYFGVAPKVIARQ
jgi:AraC family transcriptional regulator, transcriptional activator of the genes for pyochelin and ferripyochelin receptors